MKPTKKTDSNVDKLTFKRKNNMCNKFRQDENSIKIPKILNSSIILFIDHFFEFLHIYSFLSSIITDGIAKGKITKCARLHGK